MKTAILTDSGSAMTIQQAQEHGIFLLPLQVIDEEHSYQDGVDISTEELYEALRKQHTPKTSMPVGSVIEATLRTIKEQGYEEIVSVPLSSGLSSTFNPIQVMAREIGIQSFILRILQPVICRDMKHCWQNDMQMKEKAVPKLVSF